MLRANPDLPDPLVMLDGSRVRTAARWRRARRPELKRLFEHYMYGRAPDPPGNVRATVLFERRGYLGGHATLREVRLDFGPPGAPPIRLLMALPERRRGPVPAFVGVNFCGNHTLVRWARVAVPDVWLPGYCQWQEANRATAAGRGRRLSRYPVPYIVGRGYAVASYYAGDVDPDRPDMTDGIHAHYLRRGRRVPGRHEWGTIAAWAWGLQRCVDYLLTEPRIDPRRIATIGHSRMGKTALLAAAFDERVAMAVSHQAGCGGSAPSRTTGGETVRQINDAFPHWFCGEFKRFNDRPELLPFDQHCLVALCAPRPVLFTNATEDVWADPPGQFDVLRAADPVYRLLGVEGVGADRMPRLNRLLDSRLGYHIRVGKHSMGRRDWRVFLDYADKWLR